MTVFDADLAGGRIRGRRTAARAPVAFGLRARIVLLTCALSFVAAALMGGLAYMRSAEIALQTSKTALRGETQVLAERLDARVTAVGDDVLLISRAPAIVEILRALQSRGTDSSGQSTLGAARERLTKLLGAVILTRDAYISVSLVGVWGERIAGVTRTNNGLAVETDGVAWTGQMPDWARRASSNLRPGEVLIGADSTDTGHRLRLVTPIAHSGPTTGLLSVLVDTETLTDPLLNGRTLRPSVLALQADRPPVAIAGDPWPGAQAFADVDRDAFRNWGNDGGQVALTPRGQGGQVFLAVAPPPLWLIGARFGIALAVDRETLIAPAIAAQRTTLIMAVILFFLTLAISAVLARIITHPLESLTQRITSTRTVGDLMLLPSHRKDEIGDLSRAFQGLADRLVASESRGREILDAVDDGVVTFNIDGVVESVNPAARAMLPDIRIGSPIDDLVSDQIGTVDSKGMQSFTRTDDAGREAHLEAIFNRAPLADRGFATVVVRDVTEANQVAKMKEQFLSTVSHELRTPLTAVKSALVLLRHTIGAKAEEKDLHLLGLALSNTQRLARLVDDILSMEKEGAGKLDYHFRKIDLNGFLGDLVDSQGALAQAHKVRFTFDPHGEDLMVDVDPDRLEQVIINLLSNAGKFSPAGQDVSIALERHGGNAARISITDQGPGIAPEFQGRLFQRFVSDDTGASAVQAGTGLGLNIAKTMVNAMNGSIGFTTCPGEGTTFHVDLPLSH